MTIARDHSSGILRPAPQRARTQFVCLVTTVHPERGLSTLLVKHLGAELPQVLFTLRPTVVPIDGVWLCGYEPGARDLVATLRRNHPGARLLVSGRGPLEAWAQEARDAGADDVCGWPVSFHRLDEILRGHTQR